MILLDNDYIIIEHDTEHHFIISAWKKYTPSLIYREMVIKGYEIIVNAGVCKSIADMRYMPTISPEDSPWTVEIAKRYYPLLCKDKPYKSAIVLVEGTLVKLAVNSITQEFKTAYQDVDSKIITRYFKSMEEARQWIISED